MIKNTTMEDYLRKWLADHPLDAEIIEFDGYEAEQMAFDRREIDVFAEMDLIFPPVRDEPRWSRLENFRIIWL